MSNPSCKCDLLTLISGMVPPLISEQCAGSFAVKNDSDCRTLAEKCLALCEAFFARGYFSPVLVF
jgi:hypothetical protein